jgi:NitT/TauT family transport system ATP-binding protein
VPQHDDGAVNTGLVIDRISKRFLVGGQPLDVLRDVSLDCPQGSFTALIGPSGCGKSTLLRIVAGLEQADAGQVSIGSRHPDQIRAAGELGIAFQDPALLPWRSVRQNIALPLEVLGRPVRTAQQRIAALIQLVGLSGFEQAVPAELSGGMRQRVAIARALVTEPSLLLLDEPFGALDQILRRSMNLELQRIWLESRATALLVTHGIDEAVFLADRVAVMHSKPEPGHIAHLVEIPFEHPRPASLSTSAEFHQLSDRIAELLHGGSQI